MTREQIMARQQEILDGARAEERELTAGERAEFDALQRQLAEQTPGNVSNGTGPEGVGGASGQRSAELGDGEPAEAERSISPDEAARRAIAAERQRTADITSLCRNFGISPDEYIRSGASMEQVRTGVLEQLQRTGAPLSMRVTADEGDKFRDAASDAMMLRSGVAVAQPADGATQMRSMSLRDLAVECL